MKTLVALNAFVGLLCLCTTPAWAEHKLNSIWFTQDLATPESVLYVADKKDPYLLVSLIDGEGDALDGKGGIARVAPDGKVIDKVWITELNAPKGMAIYKDLLYVADVSEVVVINIRKSKIEKKIPVAGAVFLNDVTVDTSGVVYVSDTRTNKIHRIENDKPEIYMENISNANGLKVLGATLVVGAGPELLLVSPEKTVSVLAKGFAQDIDGIEMIKRGEFVVSCWAGLVYYVYADGKTELLLDTQVQKINTADIGFDRQSSTLYVPNFLKNSVTAYQLE